MKVGEKPENSGFREDMGRIFYLMGKSSSGKDTIYKELLKKDCLLYTSDAADD